MDQKSMLLDGSLECAVRLKLCSSLGLVLMSVFPSWAMGESEVMRLNVDRTPIAFRDVFGEPLKVTSPAQQKLAWATKLIVDSLPSDRSIAEGFLIEAIREDPLLVDAYATLMRFTLWQIATGSLEASELQGAAELVERVQDLAPERPLGLYLQCEMLLAMGQASQANTLYKSALEKWPNHKDTKVFEARYWSEVDSDLSLNAALQALAMGESMDNLSPAIALAITTRAQAQGKSVSSALEKFNLVYPDRWISHKAAVAALQAGDLLASKALFEKAVSLGNALESALQLGILQYTSLSQGKEAVMRFQQLETKLKTNLALNQDSLALVLCHKALALFKMGEIRDAESATAEALLLSFDSKSVLIPFSEEINRMGFAKHLVPGLKMVAEINPGIDYVHVTLGNISTEIGDIEAAIYHYTQSIALQPQRDDFFAARAHVLYRAGNFENALRDFSRASALSPSQASHLYNKGCMEARLGQFELAVASLRRSFELNKDLHKISLNDADLVELWKDEAAARQMQETQFSIDQKNDSKGPNVAGGNADLEAIQ